MAQPRLGPVPCGACSRVTVYCCGIFLWLLCNAALSSGVELKIDVLEDIQSKEIKITWAYPNRAASVEVTVDDDPYFRRPILKQSVIGQSLSIDRLKAGIFHGIPYYIRITPGNLSGTFRFGSHEWNNLLGGHDFLYRAWEVSGRLWLEQYAGVKWNSVDRSWLLMEQWPPDRTDVALRAYYIESVMRGAVHIALVDHNLAFMDELADFYLTYLKRFVRQGPDSTMTIPRTQKGLLTNDIRDEMRYNSQFFHPVSRLIRVFSTLPESEMTPKMEKFMAAYVPIVVRDHLVRFGYITYWNDWGVHGTQKTLVDDVWQGIINAASGPKWSWALWIDGIWQKFVDTKLPKKLSDQYGMHDWDLWLIAEAAEMLGANANNPDRVPLNPIEQAQLKKMVQVGVTLFKTKKTIDQHTRDFAGQQVASVSYLSSWDISSFHRVPILMLSLYDNKNATGLTYPDAVDIRQLISHYMYRVFYGDFDRPLFRNFFNGDDGPYDGYPPAKQCDAQKQGRPCMALSAAYGWGLLAPFHDDLMRLERAYITLAMSRDPVVKSFRDRYYYYNEQQFELVDDDGKVKYPISLFFIFSAVAEKML